MPEIGAQAALAGYRKQALVNLDRILAPGADGLTFIPDGIEDLDILGPDGELAELLQVKAYADDLVLSHFTPEKPHSFLRRAAARATRPDLRIIVATFGRIGPELQGAWNGDAQHRAGVVRKLREKGYTDQEVELLFSSVRFERVDEDVLRARVFARLRENLTGGDPESAFELLTNWLYQASEQGRRITPADVTARVTSVGRYLAERTAHHQEWFTSIVPLVDGAPSEERRAELGGEYALGVGARYEHIVAGHDVPRSSPLTDIHAAFESGSRAVLVHGPSGQGKTSVAFRYLHDYVPEAWRFSVRAVQDRRHALSVAAALAGHFRAFDAPMYVYVDVSPRDAEWAELVGALLEQPNARVLVTIREEDLARLAVSPTELGFPHLIPLEFGEAEARSIYEQLVARRPTEAYLSFAEAWERFGGEGPLMEFVYLVTQSESLEARLAAQVRRLKDEVRQGTLGEGEIAFLRVVSAAGAYESRVDVATLARDLGLTEPARTLELLEREYLVRRSVDGRFAEALHPIRSDVLTRLLTDPVFTPWGETAAAALPHIPETDLEAFLLYAFSRHPQESTLVAATARRLPVRTWTGIAGVCRALLWRGIREYEMRNRALIAEVREQVGAGWSILLESNVIEPAPARMEMLRLMEQVNPGLMAISERFAARQSDLAEVTAEVAEWLTDLREAPGAPETTADWAGLAEVHFWATRFGLDDGVVRWARESSLEPAVESLPLPVLGEVVLSLSHAPGGAFETQAGRYRERLLERYRVATQTVWVEETPDTLRAHFIVPVEALGGTPERLMGPRASEDTLRERASSRVELLRHLVPGREHYGVQGYGHRLGLVDLPYDPTRLTGVAVQHLPPRWVPIAHGIFNNLADLTARPATWREYAEKLVEARTEVVSSLDQLRRGLFAHFRTNQPVPLFDRHVNRAQWQRSTKRVQAVPQLPRSAVDEWGFVSESMSRPTGSAEPDTRSGPDRARAAFLVDRYGAFLKAIRNFTRPLGNFLLQAVPLLEHNALLPRAPTAERRRRLEVFARAQGKRAGDEFLPTYNLAEAWRHLRTFQTEFRTRLGGLIDPARLSRLEAREAELFPKVWCLWYQIYAHPERRWPDPEQGATEAFAAVLDGVRQRLLARFQDMPVECRVEVASESVDWEGAPALWLRMEFATPLNQLFCLPAVAQALQDVLGAVRTRGPEQFALETYWRSIVIVPTVGGCNLEGMVWRFHPFSFYDGQELGDRHWSYLPAVLPDLAADAVGIPILRHPEIQSVRSVQTAHADLWMQVAHAADLCQLPEGTIGSELEIAEAYGARYAEKMQGALERFMEAWLTLFQEVLTDVDDPHRPLLAEVHDLLLSLRSCFAPHDGEEADFGPEDLAGWARRLQEAMTTLEAIRLLRTADFLGRPTTAE